MTSDSRERTLQIANELVMLSYRKNHQNNPPSPHFHPAMSQVAMVAITIVVAEAIYIQKSP